MIPRSDRLRNATTRHFTANGKMTTKSTTMLWTSINPNSRLMLLSRKPREYTSITKHPEFRKHHLCSRSELTHWSSTSIHTSHIVSRLLIGHVTARSMTRNDRKPSCLSLQTLVSLYDDQTFKRIGSPSVQRCGAMLHTFIDFRAIL